MSVLQPQQGGADAGMEHKVQVMQAWTGDAASILIRLAGRTVLAVSGGKVS